MDCHLCRLSRGTRPWWGWDSCAIVLLDQQRLSKSGILSDSSPGKPCGSILENTENTEQRQWPFWYSGIPTVGITRMGARV